MGTQKPEGACSEPNLKDETKRIIFAAAREIGEQDCPFYDENGYHSYDFLHWGNSGTSVACRRCHKEVSLSRMASLEELIVQIANELRGENRVSESV